MSVISIVSHLWAKADRSAIRAFFLSMAALAIALLLALYSGAAADLGQGKLSVTAALGSLVLAGWVAITLVPSLARRTPLRWIGYKMDYRVTREGWIYIGGILIVALAALNTGNNLLFLILANLIAAILVSGIVSSITLSGVAMHLDLPEHIFAGQTVRAVLELENEKWTLPSFSLRVEGTQPKDGSSAVLLDQPVYFPYLPKRERLQQGVPMRFARRGAYLQDSFRIVTRFPFGFLQKAHRVEMRTEVLVYPSIAPPPELFEILPSLEGAVESLNKGRGQDLYALRDYVPTDNARDVHWKASARLGSLMVREFTREEDCRVLLVLDPHVSTYKAERSKAAQQAATERFERAVTLCAGIAWHFFEHNAQLQFRSAGVETRLAPAEQNIFQILRHLAIVQPLPADPRSEVLSQLASSPNLFKIIVTSQGHGTIPAGVWNSSYVIFLDDLRS